MTAPLPTPADVEGMRQRHVPKGFGVAYCDPCDAHWPCDAARLLALVDSQAEQIDRIDIERGEFLDEALRHKLRAIERGLRLAAVLAECDRTEDYEHRRSLTLSTLVDRIRRAATGEAT